MRKIYTGARTLVDAVKDANRARQIALIVGRHGFAQLLEAHRASREQKVSLRSALLGGETTADAPSVDVAARVVDMIEELGPTFVKFGQILSSRPGVLPESVRARMESLQDRVSPIDISVIHEIIVDNLGKPPAELYSRFDDSPIASASIGQVHGALTHDGHEVVVKVQRPGLRAIFEADLSLLRFLVAQALEVFPEIEALDLGTMISELEQNLLRETDFGNEMQMLSRFAKNFAADEHVHIPRAFPELSTAHVLTMERIVGSKLTAIEDAGLRAHTAKIYLDATYQMVFKDGLFHADMHPGNVFLQADGKLGIIDLGMVGRLSRRRREQLVDLIFALTKEDAEGVVRQWHAICRAGPEVHYETFEAEVSELLEERVIGRELDEIELAAFFTELVSCSARLGVRVPGEFMMLFKALATTEGLARQIAAGINPMDAARPHVMRLLRERYSATRLGQTALTEVSRLIEAARELPHVIERVANQLERGEARVKVLHEGRDEQNARLARAGNRLAIALLSSAAFVSGALMRGQASDLGSVSSLALGLGLAGAVWVAWGTARDR